MNDSIERNQSEKLPPSFKEAFWFWLKLGFISVGGPAGQIGIMHEFLVEKKKWISESRFMHALNYTMLLPGPEAQQLATYTGWLLHGTKGGLVAGILFVLPSMFILLVLSVAYTTFGNIPWVYAMFEGLKPAVLAIVFVALIKIGKKSLHFSFHFLVAIASFVCMFFLNVPFPYIIIGSVILAFIIRSVLPQLIQHTAVAKERLAKDEDSYYINRHHFLPNTGFNLPRILRQVLITSALWGLVFGLLYFCTSDFQFWKDLSFFFTQAAFITFGGAYTVLPYVAQVSVDQFHWLTEFQMVDGLALGETTPGPLVMVLAFVGYMAGFNHYSESILMGTLGLFVTTIYTFIPCFLFIFVGAPLIEKTRENERIKQLLTVVTAAVVGVILNLTIYLGKAIIFPEELSFVQIDYTILLWTVISFIALFRFKIGMITWIGVSALFGLVNYLFLSAV